MNPPLNKQSTPGRHPRIFTGRERHNLLLYILLLIIAFIFIVAAPANGQAGDSVVQPDSSLLDAPGPENMEHTTASRTISSLPPGCPGIFGIFGVLS